MPTTTSTSVAFRGPVERALLVQRQCKAFIWRTRLVPESGWHERVVTSRACCYVATESAYSMCSVGSSQADTAGRNDGLEAHTAASILLIPIVVKLISTESFVSGPYPSRGRLIGSMLEPIFTLRIHSAVCIYISFLSPGVHKRRAYTLPATHTSRCLPILVSAQITQSIAFAFTLFFISSLPSLPLSVYQTFVLEEKHGFNKTTRRLFVTDLLKSWAVGFVIGAPFLSAFLAIFKWAGDRFVPWLMAFLCVSVSSCFSFQSKRIYLH